VIAFLLVAVGLFWGCGRNETASPGDELARQQESDAARVLRSRPVLLGRYWAGVRSYIPIHVAAVADSVRLLAWYRMVRQTDRRDSHDYAFVWFRAVGRIITSPEVPGDSVQDLRSRDTFDGVHWGLAVLERDDIGEFMPLMLHEPGKLSSIDCFRSPPTIQTALEYSERFTKPHHYGWGVQSRILEQPEPGSTARFDFHAQDGIVAESLVDSANWRLIWNAVPE
jgi:hypothetical protein